MGRLLLLMVLFACLSCDSESLIEIRVDCIPAKVVAEEKWSLVDARGHLRVNDMYPDGVSAVVNGYFTVQGGDGLKSVYRLVGNGAYAAVDGLGALADAGYFACGLIPVIRGDGRIDAVDGFGRIRFTLKRWGRGTVAGCSAMFRDGVLSVCDGRGLWGVVDGRGNTVVKPVYAEEPVFIGGFAVVSVKDESGSDGGFRQSIIDSNGQVQFDFPDGMFPLGDVADGRIVYGTDSNCGIMDVDGGNRRVLPAVVSGVDDFDGSHLIYINAGGHRGLMTADGRIVLGARYNSLEFAGRGLLLASNARRYSLITFRGDEVARFGESEEVVNLSMDAASGAGGGFGFASREGSLWSLYDRSGCRVGQFEFVAMDCSLFYGQMPLWAGHSGDVGSKEAGRLVEFDAVKVEAVPDSVVEAADSVMAF